MILAFAASSETQAVVSQRLRSTGRPVTVAITPNWNKAASNCEECRAEQQLPASRREAGAIAYADTVSYVAILEVNEHELQDRARRFFITARQIRVSHH